jgi:hypothetical protein
MLKMRSVSIVMRMQTRTDVAHVADVYRLLRHTARLELEGLAASHAPVDPREVAVRVVYKHHHVNGVRARVGDLIADIADYIRELRAAEHEL